jgi:hypothetical protein
MVHEIKPLLIELTEEEGTNVQGGQTFFINVPFYDPAPGGNPITNWMTAPANAQNYGFVSAFVDVTPGAPIASGFAINLPSLRDLLSLVGINTTTFQILYR